MWLLHHDSDIKAVALKTWDYPKKVHSSKADLTFIGCYY